jgi:hypothetical protein
MALSFGLFQRSPGPPQAKKSTTTTPRQITPLCATPTLGYMTTNHKTRPRIETAARLHCAAPLLRHTSRAASSSGLRRMHRQIGAAYPSIADEQNTVQTIENNHSRYALSVNFLRPSDATKFFALAFSAPSSRFLQRRVFEAAKHRSAAIQEWFLGGRSSGSCLATSVFFSARFDRTMNRANQPHPKNHQEWVPHPRFAGWVFSKRPGKQSHWASLLGGRSFSSDITAGAKRPPLAAPLPRASALLRDAYHHPSQPKRQRPAPGFSLPASSLKPPASRFFHAA